MCNIQLLQGDCLELMPGIKSGSVDMILCDLPYGTMRGVCLDGWNKESTKWDVRLDDKILFCEYERILRQKGVIILFSQEPYTSELRYKPKRNIDFCYPLIWKKDHFANPLNSHNAPVSYFEDLSVFRKRHDSQLLNPLRDYFRNVIRFIGIPYKEINRKLGHRKAEHCFYVNTSQFSLCTEDTYNELIKVFKINKMPGFKTFYECKKIQAGFNRGITVFNIPGNQKVISNVLEFKKEKQRFHPTQKPVALLEYLVKIYTNPGNTVMDNCMGSGSAGVACVCTGRNFIGMELDRGYFKIAQERIEKAAMLTS